MMNASLTSQEKKNCQGPKVIKDEIEKGPKSWHTINHSANQLF